MIQQLQEWVLRVNNSVTAPVELINLLTGLIVAVTILSMGKFKFTHSAKYRWSKTLYFSATTSLLLGIGINRLVNYPSEYPLSSALYLLAYLLFSGYMLYSGSNSAQRSYNGDQTISTTKDSKSQR